MGQEHATWYKWDGETWAQTQMHLRVATPVTCGSTLKLQNLRSGHKLHAFPKMVLPQSKFKVVSGYANWYTTPKYEGGRCAFGRAFLRVAFLKSCRQSSRGFDPQARRSWKCMTGMTSRRFSRQKAMARAKRLHNFWFVKIQLTVKWRSCVFQVPSSNSFGSRRIL